MKIRYVETIEDIKKTSDLISKIFKQDNIFRHYKNLVKFHLKCPFHKNEYSRIVEVGKEIVSHLRIVPVEVRIGEAILKMGGIGTVCTNHYYRNRGFASLLVQEAIKYLKGNNFDVTILFSLKDDFYEKFGFTMAIPEYECIVKVEDIATIKKDNSFIKYEIGRFKKDDLKDIMRIYDEGSKEVVLSVVRTEEYWKWYYKKFSNAYLVKRGKIPIAYFIADIRGNYIVVKELAFCDDNSIRADELYRLILSKLSLLAKRINAGMINFKLPPDHPFIEYSLINVGANINISYKRTAGGMFQIINIENTLKKMIPQFKSYLRNNLPNLDINERFSLIVNSEKFDFFIRKNEVSISKSVQSDSRSFIKCSQQVLSKLLVGYHKAKVILSSTNSSLQGIPEYLVNALFPQRFPFFWENDHF